MISFFKTLLKKQPTIKEKVLNYCEKNPWAVSCRIYDV